ncbi:hypothetical protein KPH14_010270 [Odynerus spinipes]|uniref:Uncharacterized protein n=1 Tax=Odynerus spinipes TaxID=1348599 RepID=A0AAD9VTM6_9HYME|nr:hypothetical protein KPH14_010270 [Odynerus spinipes]
MMGSGFSTVTDVPKPYLWSCNGQRERRKWRGTGIPVPSESDKLIFRPRNKKFPTNPVFVLGQAIRNLSEKQRSFDSQKKKAASREIHRSIRTYLFHTIP